MTVRYKSGGRCGREGPKEIPVWQLYGDLHIQSTNEPGELTASYR
jgi:hypothetical protein